MTVSMATGLTIKAVCSEAHAFFAVANVSATQFERKALARIVSSCSDGMEKCGSRSGGPGVPVEVWICCCSV